MWWFQQGLSFLPALLVIWTWASFVFAYVTAVLLRHVDPLVPYISDTGTMAPERCVFGFMLDVSAFLGPGCCEYGASRADGPACVLEAWAARSRASGTSTCRGMATVYVRYKQVEALTDNSEGRLLKVNRLGLLLGLFSSLGMCVVANFQKTTLFSVHLLGAVLTFGVGAIYILVQTLLSHYMQPHVHSRSIFLLRLTIGLWTLGSVLSMFVSSVVMYSSLPGVDVTHKLHWTPGETGYTPHLISTVCEWSLAFSFISFFLTYIRDFQKITLRAEADVQSTHLYHWPRDDKPRVSESSPLLSGAP
ncbi:DNA damage-regulated autophagy modulator protein 2b isoform X2 [Entelurus aequoreus]|uniref:DNA damage-regulated autophagy modulator protein 2b isoform X2 n=1 Tax=Entelurus aequoreus TaxID=161455 RepID=UPI002B1D6E14|nr:DNA damage-regulated autophagy modulator protein 2b isoform X2 [Entelurus aequoreus]